MHDLEKVEKILYLSSTFFTSPEENVVSHFQFFFCSKCPKLLQVKETKQKNK